LQEEVQHATNGDGGAIEQQKRKEIVVVEGGGRSPILAGLEQRTTSKMTPMVAPLCYCLVYSTSWHDINKERERAILLTRGCFGNIIMRPC
jgi:hypothetical protein